MTPIRKRLTRVIALAVMVLTLTANVAAASDGESGGDCVPYDPGLPSSQSVPYDPGLLGIQP